MLRVGIVVVVQDPRSKVQDQELTCELLREVFPGNEDGLYQGISLDGSVQLLVCRSRVIRITDIDPIAYKAFRNA